MTPRPLALVVAHLLLSAARAAAQPSAYPPAARYLMPRDAEIALARTAAPPNISDRATIKTLTAAGFVVAQPGDNGNVCLVMRGFSAPTYTPAPFRGLVYDPAVRAPICFVGPAARTVLPFYEMRTTLALVGKTPDQIAAAVKDAYARGGNAFGSPLPQVTDDAGTPFTVVVIPVDDKLARHLGAGRSLSR